MRALLPVACSALAGCSLVVDASAEQCTSDASCERLGGAGSVCIEGYCSQPAASTSSSSTTSEPSTSTSSTGSGSDASSTTNGSSSEETGDIVDPAWGCADTPLPVPDGNVTLTIRLADVVTGEAPEITSARLCALLDSACMTPIADLEFTDGRAEATVAAGFEGYVEVMATDIAPSLVYVAPAVRDEERFTPLVPDALIDTSASLLGLMFNRDERGIMIAQVRDCTGELAAGISMHMNEADDQTTRFFGMLPDDNATATSADGTGGFLNVPEGFGTWSATVEATGQGVKELRFVHRAGWASLVVFDASQEFVVE